ncbi:MAG: head decoration protein [Burkholderiales bacterium]|nr:head decoration protein [Burkholderiales bacterium]
MAYATRELVSEQERDPYPKIHPAPGGVQVKTFAPTTPAATYPVGTPLAFNTSTNKWVVWTNGGSNGTGTVKGFVYPDAVTTDGTNDVMAPVLLLGEIPYEDIVLPAGESADNLKTALRSGPRDIGLHVTGLDQVR